MHSVVLGTRRPSVQPQPRQPWCPGPRAGMRVHGTQALGGSGGGEQRAQWRPGVTGTETRAREGRGLRARPSSCSSSGRRACGTSSSSWRATCPGTRHCPAPREARPPPRGLGGWGGLRLGLGRELGGPGGPWASSSSSSSSSSAASEGSSGDRSGSAGLRGRPHCLLRKPAPGGVFFKLDRGAGGCGGLRSGPEGAFLPALWSRPGSLQTPSACAPPRGGTPPALGP